MRVLTLAPALPSFGRALAFGLLEWNPLAGEAGAFVATSADGCFEVMAEPILGGWRSSGDSKPTTERDRPMTTKNMTLSQFCDAEHLSPKLIRAVVRQFGGWKSFQESAPDVCRGGIDGGFNGFIYYAETKAFSRRNRALIAEMAQAQAADFGWSVTEMIQNFGCFRNGTKPSDADIGSALYAGKDRENGEPVLNALAWYAGEKVCRSYCDIIEND